MAENLTVSFGWRLPENVGAGSRLLQATFDAEVVEYQESKDRWLVRLGQPRRDLVTVTGDADIPADIRNALAALPGRWVYIPSEARSGLTLPLKLETLTGRIAYFHVGDPRNAEVRRRISRDARAAGVKPGGVLLVHSSLSSLGYVPGGPETVIDGLLDALGPEGTLLMPALSYEWVDAAHPFFDVLKTPSNVGAIPEAYRTRAGTLRSVNPTHSVCGSGAQAVPILKDHLLDETPCGPHSPFRRLRDVGGQILFVGCGLRPNTSMHGVEELVEPPYLFGSLVTYSVTTADGVQRELRCRRHNFAGYDQRYDRLADLLKPGELRPGRILKAATHLVEAEPMWARAEAALRRDPLHFVDKTGRAQRPI